MLNYLFRRKSTKGPLLGIFIATILVAVALSLLVRWQLRQTDGETADGSNPPVIVEPSQNRDVYPVAVENKTIQIDALPRNQRMRIVDLSPSTSKVEQQVTPQPTVVAGVTQAPTGQTLVPTQQAAADNPPTVTPPSTVPPQVTAVPQQQSTTAADFSVINGVAKILFIDHLVAAGETIYSLTKRYNTSVTMMSEHGVSEADMIPGQVISVAYPNGAACSTQRAYAIREGDTLYRIAVNSGTTVETLQQVNGFGANIAIDAGSAICLP